MLVKSDEEIVHNLIPCVAIAWENAITCVEPADRFNHLLYGFEALLKTLSSVAYCKVQAYNIDAAAIDSTFAETFATPTLGDWSTLLRVSRNALASEKDAWADHLQDVVELKTADAAVIDLSRKVKALQGLNWSRGSIRFGEVFSILIELRNRTRGHGVVSPASYPEWNNVLGVSLRLLIAACWNCLSLDMYLPERVRLQSAGARDYDFKLLRGNHKRLESQTLDEDIQLLNGRLYICDKDLPTGWFTLWPLMHWDAGKQDVCLYNQSPSPDRVEYISYGRYGNLHLGAPDTQDLRRLLTKSSAPQRILSPVQTSSAGVINNLPTPDWYRWVARPELEREVLRQVSHPRMYITTLDGIGGCGKTALALKAAYDIVELNADNSVQFAYVVWVTAKATRLELHGIVEVDQQLESLDDLLKSILRVAGLAEYAEGKRGEELEALTFDVLSMASFLIIIDNLETVKDVDRIWSFLIDPRFAEPTKVLVTSRHRQDRAELVVNVRGMTKKEAEELVEREYERLGMNCDRLPSSLQIDKLLAKTGGIPIAMKQVVGQTSLGVSFQHAVDRLPERPGDVLDFCFPESFRLLDESAKLVFFYLAKIGGSTGIKELWFLTSLSEAKLDRAIMDLSRLSLVERSTAGEQGELYHLLPLTQKFAERELSRLPEEEASILSKLTDLDQLRRMTPSGSGPLPMYGIATAEKMLQVALSSAARSMIDKAEYWFQKAIEANPRNPEIWLAKAKYQHKDLRDTDAARQSYMKAAELAPRSLETLVNWGHMERSERNLDKAVDLFTQATEIDNTDRFAAHGLGLTLFEKGVDEKRYGKLQHNSTRVHRGNDLLAKSKDKLLGALFPRPTSYLERHHNVVTYNVLSKVYNRLGRRKEAILSCEEALGLEPENGRIASWLDQLRSWQDKDY